MRRVGLAAVVLLALTGCMPFGMGPMEARTDRIADQLEGLSGVDHVEREFSDKGFMKSSENSTVVVYLEQDPELDDVVGLVERFRETDWQGDPATKLSIRTSEPGPGWHSFSPAGLPDEFIARESRLWLDLVQLNYIVSQDYEVDGPHLVRGLFGFFDKEFTLTETVGLLRTLRGLDYGDLPSSWSFSQLVEGTGETGGFSGAALPGDAALDALVATDAAMTQLGRPIERFSVQANDHIHLFLRVGTPEFDGLTEIAALQQLLDSTTWTAAITAAQVLEGSGERFSLVVSTDVVGSFAAIDSGDCGRAFEADEPFSTLLWEAWLGDRVASDGSTARVC